MKIQDRQPKRKEKFYVFSGIEKTLISKNFIDAYYSGVPHVHGEIAPDPTCMRALNYLLKELEQKYDVRLVITSKKRFDPSECEHYLNLYGLDYHKPIFYTKYVSGPRGEKIVDFLEEQGASPLTFHTAPLYVRFLKNFKENPDFKNYVVLEGGNRSISKYIPKEQITKIDKRRGFSMLEATEILLKHGIEPSTMNPLAHLCPDNK